jgi:hypothetical protein
MLIDEWFDETCSSWGLLGRMLIDELFDETCS